MTINIGSGLKCFSYPTRYHGPARDDRPAAAPGAVSSSFSRAVEEMMAEAVKTPAERARDAVIRKHGLDEQTYAALDPAGRKLLDAEIAEALKGISGGREMTGASLTRWA
ncbi:hypothetical protein K3177_14845 [Qipengyuania sp. GH25]|uniref:Uncharacterized protein n=1 Tax=Qipengyuania pacifica TaxID=2860199 RepID=A0ABS7JK72_9SPHN|nr:hypothetical protein [Qipengyuania aerophila]MBX7489783.1 hypothetical protein [Qipengyuania aerophila]